MKLTGKSLIAGQPAQSGTGNFQAVEPATGEILKPAFDEAGPELIDRALAAASDAFDIFRELPPESRAAFLEAIGEEIVGLGDELIERASAESGLPKERLTGERGRTVNQLKMFATLVREGSWVDARIDRAIPDRQPIPKPDIRRMLLPIGPVAVFGASNFPLAFSVAGGDTSSALAAGCPVVVKGHPAHPGTSEMVATAIARAAEKTGVPAGVFSLLQGARPELSIGLVTHPGTCAVGFTGSQRAGKALFDAAMSRPDPIPVYAEMGSINPVFVLPGALRERGSALAEGLKGSITLGVGQFCTNPGLTVGLKDEHMNSFAEKLAELMADAPAGTMLTRGILAAYDEGVRRIGSTEGVTKIQSRHTADLTKTQARAAVFTVDGSTFLRNPHLSEEVFGPSSIVVSCASVEEMLTLARGLEGHLTATVHGTDKDLEEFGSLIRILEKKVGRIVFNGYPTGVEVCASMHHGGPYPATTDSRSTSVGTAAILRFARPVCYQNFPQKALPVELRDHNERGIWRLIDDNLSRDDA